MEEEHPKRYKRETVTETSLSQVYSQQHHVYYYSSFDLFQEDSIQDEFYQFSMFLERVSNELGNQWKNEAQHLYYPRFTHQHIFMNLMELWLKQHPTVNSQRIQKAKLTTFSPSFLNQFIQKMQETQNNSTESFKDLESLNQSSKTIKPPNTAIKAVCLGFFMTANQIWQEMFQSEQNKKPDLFSANNFFKQVSNSLQKTFKPLMVVTSKIETILGRKKRKCNEEAMDEECNEKKFENCYHQFIKTLDKQKEIERKMSDLILEDDLEENNQQSKIYQKKQFQMNEAPLQPGILSSIYHYVTGFLQRNPSWKVANHFVTQILELNQVKMQEGTRVKVMRPAQDFYEKLVMVWLMLQQNQHEGGPQINSVPFQTYLQRLKSAFFTDSWVEKYVIPTKYFFEKMKKEWNAIKNMENTRKMSEKQVLRAFLGRIKLTMQAQWDSRMIMRSKQ